MSTTPNKILNFAKRFGKYLLLVILLLLIGLFIFWIIIRKDSPAVLNKIKSHAAENWNADLDLEGYELKLQSPFPHLELHLNNLSFGMSDSTRHPIVKTNKAILNFDPWDLYRDQELENYLEIDSSWIMIHHDSLDNSNLHFSNSKNESAPKNQNFDFANVINIKANYINFKNQNDFRHVWQSFQLTNAEILPGYNSRKELTFMLSADAHFDGLVFKSKDGPFLKNTSGALQVNLGWNKKEGLIRMDDSYLQTNRDDFQISGLVTQGEVDKIHLDIIDDDILLSELLPKLSDKARAALGKIKVDQPIKGHFSLDNLIIPNRNGAVKIDFETTGANIQYGEASISGATLKGSYNNDCDGNGLGDPVTSCIILDQLDGEIFGRLPTELRGSISNLREPAVDMVGKMKVNFPRLNPLLTTKEKMNFNDGRALINFNYTGDLRKIVTDPFNDEFTEMKGNVAFDDVVIKTGDNGLVLPALSGHMTFSESQSRLQDLSLNWMGSNILIKGQVGNLPEFLFYRKEALQSDLDLYFDELDLNRFRTSKTPDNKITPAILDRSIRSLAFNINGNIDLKIDKLIFDTLFVSDVNTRFELFTPTANTTLDSTLIQIDQLSGNLFGETPFELDLKILQEQETAVNIDLSIPAVAKSANRFLPANTKLIRGEAGLALSAKSPLAALFNSKQLYNELRYEGIFELDSIELLTKGSAFPINNLTGPLAFNSDQLLFDKLGFQYKGSPFELDGTVENYAFFRTNNFRKGNSNLTIKGNYFDARDEASNSKSQEEQQAFSPPEIFRSLDTIFHYSAGKINVQLDSILTNGHTIEPFYMQANLLPDSENNSEHQFLIDTVRMGFGAQNYVQGNMLFSDVENPKVIAQLDANMSLSRMGDLLPSAYIDLIGGDFQMQMDYQSELHDTLAARNYILKAEIEGDAEITNGSVYYNYRDFTFDEINGQFSFDENSLKIPSLSMYVNDNDLRASGESIDFFPFFILPDQKASIDLSIASDKFNIENFSTPQKIKTHATGIKDLEVITKKDPASNAIEQTLGLIDQLIAQGTIKMDTEIKSVNYRKFDAADFHGLVVVKPDTVLLSDVNMNVAKGTFGIDGLISGIADHQPTVAVAMEMRDNDLQEILTQFENFDQAAFTDENIKGAITADVNFESDITDDYAFKSESMKGDMFVRLSGGELKDIAALSSKKNFLTKGRKLNHILLDTLEFKTLLKGNELIIKPAKVNSSPGNFNVVGVYDLEDQQNSKLLFTVPLRNVFKRYNNLEEMEANQYKGKGIPVLIESRFKNGKLKFKWKLFVNRKKRGYVVSD